MTQIRYRVVYRDGAYSAWDTDKEWIELLAKKYRGFVEVWEVKLP